MEKLVVGVIGTGRMGNPMARNLLKAGYQVNVYDVRESAYQMLLELGASSCGSPGEIGRRSDIVLLSLLNADTVREVLFGVNGLASVDLTDKIIIDTSTYAPSDTRSIAARIEALGGSMLDAPLTGGEVGARDGTLNIMVGGAPDVLERVYPLLTVLGTTIIHIGPSGAGQVAKMLNQMLMGGLYALIAEAFAFAEKANVDLDRILEAIETGGAQSKQLSQMGKMYREAQTDGVDPLPDASDHYLQVYSKDVYCVLQEAHSNNSYTPLTAATHEIFKQVLSGTYRGRWPLKLIELWRDPNR